MPFILIQEYFVKSKFKFIHKYFFLTAIFIGLFSCKTAHHFPSIKSFGGAWENKKTVSTKIPDQILISAAPARDTVPSEDTGFLNQNIQTSPILQAESQNAKWQSSVTKHQPYTIFKAHAKAEDDEELYKNAKWSLFAAVISGMLYFVGYTILGQPAFSFIMWLPALVPGTGLFLLSMLIALAISITIIMAWDVLKKMKKSGQQKGKVFATLAMLAALGMAVSMAPIMAYFLISVLIILLQTL